MLCPSLLAADKMLIKFAGTMSNLWIRAFVVFLEAQESASQNQPRVLQQKKQETVDHAQTWSNGQLIAREVRYASCRPREGPDHAGVATAMDGQPQASVWICSILLLWLACRMPDNFFGTKCVIDVRTSLPAIYLPVKCHLISKATSPNISHISWHFTCQRPRHQHHL